MDKKTFCCMLIGLGYDKIQVENCWIKAKKVMDYYDLPVEKVLECTIYALNYNCSIKVPLKDICGVDVDESEEMISSWENSVALSLGLVVRNFAEYLRILNKRE